VRFISYLNEKVSKSEINAILKDDSIICGAEFEFFLRALKEYEERNFMGYEVDFLMKLWERWTNDLWEWKNNVEDAQDEIQGRRFKLERKLMNLEDPGSEEADEIRTELENVEMEMDEIFEKIPPPEVPEELIDYSSEVDDYGVNLDRFNFIEFLETPDKIWSLLEIIKPRREMFALDPEKGLEYATRILNENLSMNFVNNKSPKMGDNFWGVVEDESVPIDAGGVEVISPPLPLPEAVDEIKKFLDFIDKNGETNSQTGLHINLSLKGVNLQKELDVVKLFLFYDEGYVLNLFKERKGNDYAREIKNKLFDENYDFNDLNKIFKTNKMKKKLSTSHYYGINLENISEGPDKSRVEFRYIGHDNYEKKWGNIKSTVANYAFNLKLACDSNYKRKEYVKKLNRVIIKKMEKNKWSYFDVLLTEYVIYKTKKDYKMSNLKEKSHIIELNNMKNRNLKNLCVDIITAFQNFRMLEKESTKTFVHNFLYNNSLLKEIEAEDFQYFNFIERILKTSQIQKMEFPSEFYKRIKYL